MKGPDIPMYSDIQDFVAQEDLPAPLPTVLLVGANENGARICRPRQRWLEIRGKPGTKGIPTSKVGVVPKERVERNPKLPVPKEWQGNFNKISK